MAEQSGDERLARRRELDRRHSIGGGTKGARAAMAPPDFRLMVLAPPDFIQLVMVVFKHIPTLVT